MQKIIRLRSDWTLIVAVAAVLFGATEQQATARPPFLPVFVKHYDVLAAQIRQAKCTVCHSAVVKGTKKPQNIYGEALKKALRRDNIGLIAAMKKVENEPSAIEGKTFGDLIREGRLPSSRE